ncbi:MAG: SAM-dependent methyltransferase [Lysobacterales bacterium CG17_big_fil_post_rev_8_21_14_2_50_64_11]|nr:MAG: SAM-dependent methyltransferase [Xanthomonadales bacterium CG17_big_fil_post_rev_8_21_14_2_50_64_11]
MADFADHFSAHAAHYASARPCYPDALFAWLAQHCAAHDLAWDAGCGNGQASSALAKHFTHVYGSDPSRQQIAQAPAHPRVRYAVETAENCSLADASVDLISVAQAYHWFAQTRFCDAVRRVARPGALLAIYSYQRSSVNAAVDALFEHLYHDVLGRYWPAQRVQVETGYREVWFPFAELHDMPVWQLRCDWTLPQYLAYLRSWSACQTCLAATGNDPLHAMQPAFIQAWGEPTRVRRVVWPLNLRVGRIVASG